MTIFRSDRLLLFTAVALAASGSSKAQSDGWTYREVPHPEFKTVEAFIHSRDGRAILAINCSFAAEPTLSIQYRPGSSLGIAMAPIILDWARPSGAPLGSNLVWEPDKLGAYVRDGVDDRNASRVAELIDSAPAALKILAADYDGQPVETYYDSKGNLDAIKRVLAQCPWNPPGARSK